LIPAVARRVLLISNPVASGVDARVELSAMMAMKSGGGIDVDLVRTEHGGHAGELAVAAAAADYDAVVVLAGDGTANDVLNAVGPRIPIGVLPGGGTSVLARALGLPDADPPRAALRVAAAVRAGRSMHLRLGMLNDRRFAFAAGIGADAEIVRRVDKRGRGRGHRPGDAFFALQAAAVLGSNRYRGPRATLVAGDRTERVAFLIAAKLDPWTFVGPRGLHAGPLAERETALDLLGPRRFRRRDLPHYARRLLDGGHARADDPRLVYLHDVSEATLTCDEPLPAQVDGDDIGDVSVVRFGIDDAGAHLLI